MDQRGSAIKEEGKHLSWKKKEKEIFLKKAEYIHIGKKGG